MRIDLATILLAPLLFVPGLAGQTVEVVADINTFGPQSDSFPYGPTNSGEERLIKRQQFVQIGAHVYFAAKTESHGFEVYRSDGRPQGTERLTDINPGPASSDPNNFCALGSKLFFSASHPSTGFELYVMDTGQTPPQARLVLDISPGNSSPNHPVAHGRHVYFSARNSAGAEVWRSDGTAAGTHQVADINPGSASSEPQYFCGYQGKVYFSARDAVFGRELWCTDGTAAGTQRVSDINTNGGSFVELLNTHNNLLFFVATAPLTGDQLYSYDGTSVSLVPTSMLNNWGARPRGFTVMGGYLYYAGNYGNLGRELCRTDGSKIEVFDIVPQSSSNPEWICAAGNRLSMQVSSPTQGFEFCTFDGSQHHILDLWPGAAGSTPTHTVGAANGITYFKANGGVTQGAELWRSDGTAAGTYMVEDLHPGLPSSNPTSISLSPAGGVLFAAQHPQAGVELFASDGTAAGTGILTDINQGTVTYGAEIYGFISHGNMLYFSADDQIHGRELWCSDGTAAGTRLLIDLDPGAAPGSPSNFRLAGNRLFFTAVFGTAGIRLCCLDLATGVWQRIDAVPYRIDAQLSEFVTVGDRCFFSAHDPVHGLELWCSDGTVSGTRLAADIVPGALGSVPRHLCAYQGRLYFSAATVGAGSQLHYSDGTAAGTGMLLRLSTRAQGADPRFLTVFRDKLVFTAHTDAAGFEMVVSDGTAAGTVPIDHVPGPAAGLYPTPGFNAGSNLRPHQYAIQTQPGGGPVLYCSGFEAATGVEPYRFDGSTFTRLGDLAPGTDSSSPEWITPCGPGVVFSARVPGPGRELFAWDGNSTQLLRDLNPRGDSSISPFFALGHDRVLFQSAYRVWVTDGTRAGTVELADFNLGLNRIRPRAFASMGGRFYFTASHPSVGDEPLVMDFEGFSQRQRLGCGGGRVPPLLDVDDLRIGQTGGLQIQDARPLQPVALLMGFVADPARMVSLPRGCLLGIDVTRPFNLLFLQTDARGSLRAPVVVPNTPALANRPLGLQCAVGGSPLPPAGVDLSDLVTVDIGR